MEDIASDQDRRMLLLGRQAPPSNTDLALPVHEVYAVECNKSISLIKARVQRHFPFEKYRVDPAEDERRMQEQAAEQAAKAQAAEFFHQKVKKRAAEVHRQLKMQKLLPVKEIEQRKEQQSRSRAYSQQVAQRNSALLVKKAKQGADAVAGSPPAGSPSEAGARPLVSKQTRYHLGGINSPEQGNLTSTLPQPEFCAAGNTNWLASSTSAASSSAADNEELAAQTARLHLHDAAAAGHLAAGFRQQDYTSTSSDALSDISQQPDRSSTAALHQELPQQPSADHLPAPHSQQLQAWHPQHHPGALQEHPDGEHLEGTPVAGQEPLAPAAETEELPEPAAAPTVPESWQRMETAVDAARSRLASMSVTGELLPSCSSSEALAPIPCEEGLGHVSQAPSVRRPFWAPRHPGLPTAAVPKTIRILRSSAGLCNNPDQARASKHT